VRKVKKPEDLTIDELRQLIVEKQQKVRLDHLERFRKTGRVVSLVRDHEIPPLHHLHSDVQELQDDADFATMQAQKKKRVFDRFLLAIEILAVLALFVVIFYAIQIIGDLNAEFAQSLVPATLTPTPLIVPVVLPSGHTPPDSPGGAQPNTAEIPAHLLPLYQSFANIPIPTPGPEQATQIQIAAIKVDAPVVQGDSWEQLKKGVAQHIGTANPGQAGNMVLSAHNDVYGEIFRNLDQLEPGDEVIVYTAINAYTYIVTNVQIVAPTDVEIMEPTTGATVTLISCYPYLKDTKRIIVQGSLQNEDN
jgi:sortase A